MKNSMDRDLLLMRLGNKGADYDVLKSILKIRRLAKAHKVQCENSCNGVGWVHGTQYTTGEAGPGVVSAYVKTWICNADINKFLRGMGIDADDETTVFDVEMRKIEK